MLITPKTVYTNRLFKYLIVIGGVLSILLYLILPFHGSFTYFVCMVCLFAGVVYVFYLNKNELLTLKGEDKEVEFSFINNSFFKRKKMKLLRSEIEMKQIGEIIELFTNQQIFAIIRKEAVTESEWEDICNYFGGESV